MDRSVTTLDFLLGKHKVSPYDVARGDRVAVVISMLTEFGSHLDYLPGFSRLGVRVSERLASLGSASVQEYPEGLNSETRCAPLPCGEYRPSQEEVRGSNASYPKHTFHREVFLSQKRQLFAWELEYECEIRQNRQRSVPRFPAYSVLRSDFRYLRPIDLTKILSPQHMVGVLEFFRDMARKAENDRALRLKRDTELRECAQSMLDRLKPIR